MHRVFYNETASDRAVCSVTTSEPSPTSSRWLRQSTAYVAISCRTACHLAGRSHVGTTFVEAIVKKVEPRWPMGEVLFVDGDEALAHSWLGEIEAGCPEPRAQQ